MAEAVSEFGLPLVDVFDWVELPAGAHRVGIDDYAVGRLAATFLAARGLRNFAFVGELSRRFALRRFQGFREQLADEGFTCEGYHGAVHRSAWSLADGAKLTEGPLADFLRGLPAQTGVFGANDDVAVQVLDAAHLTGRHVPDELAILGVDDDALLCSLPIPPLSSINSMPVRVGTEACRVLQQLVDGLPCPRETLLFPGGVVERQSTDVSMVADDDVAQALRWLREHADRPVRIDDLLQFMAMSRRSLELKFAQHVGRSPHSQLTHFRLDRACALLRETDLPIQAVARRSGFRHPGRLAATFRQDLKQTPMQYRKLFRTDNV
jgi:LacI family transcriptional regulator